MFTSLIHKNEILTTLTSRGILLYFHNPSKATLQRTLQQLDYGDHLCIPVNAGCVIAFLAKHILKAAASPFSLKRDPSCDQVQVARSRSEEDCVFLLEHCWEKQKEQWNKKFLWSVALVTQNDVERGERLLTTRLSQ